MPISSSLVNLLISNEEDFDYEEQIQQNPYQLRSWWSYIQHKQRTLVAMSNSTNNNSDPFLIYHALNVLYERSLKALPHSYKLWYHYIQHRITQLNEWETAQHQDHKNALCLTAKQLDECSEAVIHLFERSLIFMHKYPRIWTDYIKFLQRREQSVKRLRQVFDRALLALPASQHGQLWQVFVPYCMKVFPKRSCQILLKRYLMLKPSFIGEYIQYLMDSELYSQVLEQLLELLNDPHFTSLEIGGTVKTKHHLWIQFCDIVSKHPDAVSCTSIHVEQVLKDGITHCPNHVSDLWCALASYYVNMGQFDRAFDIYEEAMEKVSTVRDWNQIFESYASVLDELVATLMKKISSKGGETITGEGVAAAAAAEEEEEEAEEFKVMDEDDLEMYIAKYEYLMERRPFLANAVKLRQNPHNVHEWHKRAKLYGYGSSSNSSNSSSSSSSSVQVVNSRGKNETSSSSIGNNVDDNVIIIMDQHHHVDMEENKSMLKSDDMVVKTLTDAIQTVDPMKATGKAFTLWTSLARFYETKYKDLQSARDVFNRAIQSKQPRGDDLASIWCEYVEMELRHNNWREAKKLLQEATRQPSQREYQQGDLVRATLYKNAKIWSLYADVEESWALSQSIHHDNAATADGSVAGVGIDGEDKSKNNTREGSMHPERKNLDAAISVYERMIDLKIVTCKQLLNYANLLWENKYFEEAFRTYERGIRLFGYPPQVFHIWVMYLNRFVRRYASVAASGSVANILVTKSENNSSEQQRSHGSMVLLGSSKLERMRDLFEQGVKSATDAVVASSSSSSSSSSGMHANVAVTFAKSLFIMYAQLEEEYGLVRHAMNIYERATHSLGNNMSDVYDMYLIYISRAAQYYGVTKTRDIYEQAIHYLEQLLSSPNSTIGDVKYIRDMCLKYADLEKKLGEIDRSRAIYAHCAKYCDPRVDQTFWQSWTQFEKLHGNIDTFKEMLRIKRSVETQYATVNVMTRGMLQAQEEREKLEEEHKQMKLKRKREDIGGDVTARDIESLEQSKNPDELDI